jgi:CRISPR-associated exonuclease Cas4
MGEPFSEDDFLPLSGLQHLTFCERRFGLIHIEGLWGENRFTAEGRVLHERVHSGEIESRPGVLIRRTVPIRSASLGLSGQADVVEFTPAGPGQPGCQIAGRSGLWRPYPIEFKRRKGRGGNDAYRLQLCAQAICLEESFGVQIPEGAIYDGSTRRRSPVAFDAGLRGAVGLASARMHQIHRLQVTPAPVLFAGCQSCSLYDHCLPRALQSPSNISAYLSHAIRISASDPAAKHP